MIEVKGKNVIPWKKLQNYIKKCDARSDDKTSATNCVTRKFLCFNWSYLEGVSCIWCRRSDHNYFIELFKHQSSALQISSWDRSKSKCFVVVTKSFIQCEWQNTIFQKFNFMFQKYKLWIANKWDWLNWWSYKLKLQL